MCALNPSLERSRRPSMHKPVDSKHDRYDDQLEGNDADSYDDLSSNAYLRASICRV